MNPLVWIDGFLNRTTMYRLVLYYLVALVTVAVAFCFFGVLPFDPFALLFSTLLLIGICWVANEAFAWYFKAPANIESLYITALILALIIPPPTSQADLSYFGFAVWAAILAMASKFALTIGKKHIFNPAALAVAVTALTLGRSASWWVGTAAMVPAVLLGGLLIVRKLRKSDLAWSFLITATVTVLVLGVLRGSDPLMLIRKVLLDSPTFFFVFVMLTEPLTTPPTRSLRMLYGAAVGFLFAPQVHIGGIYSTPELALLVGNVLSYLVSPKTKLMLKLARKERIADNTLDIVFTADRAIDFRPGQYLEWTMPHKGPDARGNRRYFTIASSPTEKELHMGVKFYPKPSTFKKTLIDMKAGDVIMASQLAGDFVMPKDPAQKLVFIAGGIGVTPFRSMVKYLHDMNEKHDIVLFYCNKTPNDIAYGSLFAEAANIGLRTVNVIAEPSSVPAGFECKTGFLTEAMIKEVVPDHAERVFYISGPHVMVNAYEKTLAGMGVPRSHIKIDYFPGFA